ncbi:MAG: glycosyltransferase family 4 protein [Lactobacillales bacterium]|jgi:1,2-diacylglycerol-3-alpha-glucose alpha-1,2-galactosyltransferase|nr:glycosyltransferase family 4 protein [Lactobacillales bacterium]
MQSSAHKIAGQGVGSAYFELIKMLGEKKSDSLDVTINKRTKADITHFHTVDFQFYVSTLFKGTVGRTLGYVHFVPDTLDGSLKLPKIASVFFNKYLVAFYKRMDHLIVVNPSFIDELVKIGIPRENVTYIPNFVSKEKWYDLSPEAKSDFRKSKGFTDEQTIILGAGQIQKRKGIDDFYELAVQNPDTQFIWAGGFSFGMITDGYEKYKKMMKNPPANLTFTGIIDRSEMMNYYNIADTFLLPSYTELFPMTILEAATCGTPIMLRDLELYHSILEGQYMAAADFAEMDKFVKEITADPSILDAYKEKAREVASYYSEEHLAEIWEEFYYSQAGLETLNESIA